MESVCTSLLCFQTSQFQHVRIKSTRSFTYNISVQGFLEDTKWQKLVFVLRVHILTIMGLYPCRLDHYSCSQAHALCLHVLARGVGSHSYYTRFLVVSSTLHLAPSLKGVVRTSFLARHLTRFLLLCFLRCCTKWAWEICLSLARNTSHLGMQN